MVMISLLIPVFNEEKAISDTINRCHMVLSQTGEEFEIVVINDGSTDRTNEILEATNLPSLHIIKHPNNQGYGSSIKTGIRHSGGGLIATIDADGTYPIEELPVLFAKLKETCADMVVGARTKKGAKIPFIRRPAKAIVSFLANTLTGMHIPDNNSGMRIFTRSLAQEFMHLYPQRFSFTITITLAALTNGYIVEFVPIDYFKRTGKSTLSGFNGFKHFLQFLGLIIRITTYFQPLRFFMWPGMLLIGLGAVTMGYTLWKNVNISDAGLLLLLTGMQIFLFGILAEVVVRQRQPGHVSQG